MATATVYRCVKPFAVKHYDDDGYYLGGAIHVAEESAWRKTDEDIIGGDIHLRNLEDPSMWIEIPEFSFNHYFEAVTINDGGV